MDALRDLPASASAHGDVRATLERLYIDHVRVVRAICARMLRDRAEVDDAVQQAFLSAFQALANGGRPRDAAAWLATIARNECLQRRRRHAPAALADDDVVASDGDPAVQALERAELAAIWQTVGGLPPGQRDALLLREVRGLSYDELADGLHVSRASARSLLLRARRTVQARLERGAAAFGGVSWVDTLGRLVAAGNNPSVSAVTRAAAVGLGAVAVAGGAVVVPTLGDTAHTRPAPSAPRPAVARIHPPPALRSLERTAPTGRRQPMAAVRLDRPRASEPGERRRTGPAPDPAVGRSESPAASVPATQSPTGDAPAAPNVVAGGGAPAVASSPASGSDPGSNSGPSGSHDGGTGTASEGPGPSGDSRTSGGSSDSAGPSAPSGSSGTSGTSGTSGDSSSSSGSTNSGPGSSGSTTSGSGSSGDSGSSRGSGTSGESGGGSGDSGTSHGGG